MNALEDICDGNYVHLDINEGDDRLKIRDHIRQAQSEKKGRKISAKMMGKGLHKFLKAVVN